MDDATSAIDVAAALAHEMARPSPPSEVAATVPEVESTESTVDEEPASNARRSMVSTIERVVPPAVRDAALSPFLVFDAIGRAFTSSGSGLSLPVAAASVVVGLLVPVKGSRRRWITFGAGA
jgi:hypothetical protein